MNFPNYHTINNYCIEPESRVEWEIENIINEINNSQNFELENSKDFNVNFSLDKFETFLEDTEDSNEICKILSKLNKINTSNSEEIYNIINRNKIKNFRSSFIITNDTENNEASYSIAVNVKKISLKGRVLKSSNIENLNKNDNENLNKNYIPTLKPNVIRRNCYDRVVPERISRRQINNNMYNNNNNVGVNEMGFSEIQISGKSIIERIKL
jgi:predicted RND superfamily exporter protein